MSVEFHALALYRVKIRVSDMPLDLDSLAVSALEYVAANSVAEATEKALVRTRARLRGALYEVQEITRGSFQPYDHERRYTQLEDDFGALARIAEERERKLARIKEVVEDASMDDQEARLFVAGVLDDKVAK